MFVYPSLFFVQLTITLSVYMTVTHIHTYVCHPPAMPMVDGLIDSEDITMYSDGFIYCPMNLQQRPFSLQGSLQHPGGCS